MAGGAPEPEDFDLEVVRPHLEDVLVRLPTLVAQPLDEVDWHVRYRCEWCEYLDYCRSEMVERDNVSRLAGLTAHGKRFLGRTLRVRTLPDLSAALRRADADDRLLDCASLAGERPRLEARLAAYASGKPGVFGSLHPALPEMRDLARDQLVAWPPKHGLLSSAGIDHPRLSRLAFLARYESVIGCLAVRAARCEARDVMAAKGTLRPLVHEGEGRFRVAADGVEIDDGGFDRWLVVRDAPEGLRAQARFNDWAHRARHWGGRADAHVGIGKVAAVETDPLGFARTVHIDWTHWHDPPIDEGARVLLMPSFLDFNTDRAIDGLKQLAIGGLFVRLLDDPVEAAGARGLSRAVVPVEAAAAFHLTPSQTAALRTIAHSRVTAVWGPPGTGKTHFLAALALGLCGAPRRRRRCRILISAMTHAAIDNLLRTVLRLADDFGRPAAALAKVGGPVTDARGRIERIVKEQLDSWLDEHDAAIVGSTVWGLAKSEARFDLVVIDEASQLRVPDAALAINRVHERGRLVAAGDHHQLGPIIAGAYPDPADGEPVLQGSVFDLLRARPGRPGTPLCQLLENWRMCDVLTGAARLLYGSEYGCASPDVSSRRLRRRRDEITGACLAPDAPLVVVILKGVQATNANEVEAALVSRLAGALRDDMVDVADDDAFWRERLLIVSPHHAQIRAIRRALAGDRDWSARPFVDTVEKMQGREADAVFVSYGVADPELRRAGGGLHLQPQPPQRGRHPGSRQVGRLPCAAVARRQSRDPGCTGCRRGPRLHARPGAARAPPRPPGAFRP